MLTMLIFGEKHTQASVHCQYRCCTGLHV